MIFYDYNLRYEIRKLEDNETIKSFDCGDADLNDFIINEAHHYRKALLAVTYIFEDKETGNVIGYFSLANDRISLTDFNNMTWRPFSFLIIPEIQSTK